MHPAPQCQQISLNPAHLPLMIGLPVGYKNYACSSFLKISDISVLKFLWVTLWTRTHLYSHRWEIDTGQVQIKCCLQKQCFSKLKTVTRGSWWSTTFLTASQFHWRYRFYLIFYLNKCTIQVFFKEWLSSLHIKGMKWQFMFSAALILLQVHGVIF